MKKHQLISKFNAYKISDEQIDISGNYTSTNNKELYIEQTSKNNKELLMEQTNNNNMLRIKPINGKESEKNRNAGKKRNFSEMSSAMFDSEESNDNEEDFRTETINKENGKEKDQLMAGYSKRRNCNNNCDFTTSKSIDNIEISYNECNIKTEQTENNSSQITSVISLASGASSDDCENSENVNCDMKTTFKVELADASSSTTRTSCWFGVRCYRRNPRHRIEEAHPGDSDYTRPDYPPAPSGTPICQFDNQCYRRNPVHFKQYAHSTNTNTVKNCKQMQLRQRQKQCRNAGGNRDFDANVTDLDDFDDFNVNNPFADDGTDSEYELDTQDFEDNDE